jgi:hypothetical protein
MNKKSQDPWSVQDPRDSESPFGVLEFLAWDHEWNDRHCHGDKVERSAELMKEAGVGFVRMDFLWSDIEPEKRKFDFEKYDRIVDILTNKGIKILGLLEYNPLWVTPWNRAPVRTDYVHYAVNVVEHYRAKIKYWEIWNEPDFDFYWTPQDEMRTYSLLLRDVYPALKKVDPTCVVVLGGLSRDYPFHLERVYENEAGPLFDVVNLHPFTNPLLSNAMELLRNLYDSAHKVMEKYGDQKKPIWFTELGCPGTEEPVPKGWWLGRSPTEKQQALWVKSVYGEPLQWKGVKKVFWAFFRDTPGYFRDDVDHFGLLREDFSKKPAFESYKVAVKAFRPSEGQT